jgi:formylglycine-generating enzyme required for sulfatase activity
MAGVREEVAGRAQAMREAGEGILPPLLLLGVMERVGSNWVSDTLRPVTGQHNEPFRQQLSPAHPLSALNPGLNLQDASLDTGPYGRHWLVTFAAAKHAPVRQVIKETNLFFALPALLDLFPGSPVAVLTRSPVGVASSFARGDLFRRWGYRARYRQMAAMATRPEYTAWAGVVPDDDPPELAALARLQVLNSLIIASALHERGALDGLAVIRYETAVLDPAAARAALAGLVPEVPGFATHGVAAGPPAEDTFATTTHKEELTACLTAGEAGEVSTAAGRALSAGRHAVPAPAWDLARDWASGDRLYSLGPPPARPLPRRTAPSGGHACPVRWVAGHAGSSLRWRNLLVTNDEFAAFLNEMAAAGLPNCMDGCYLLAVEMPRERGGRLHYNHHARRWTVSPGFGTHPAYWVTWTGAAAYAARHGARLPSRAEMIAETSRDALAVTNYAYQAGDTVPVAEPGRDPGEVHHLAGNLQVWCSDGPAGGPPGPASRWLHGAAWNTPGTPDELHRPRARHLSGASRGVGIRLVRDHADQPAATTGELAEALTGWIRRLARRDQPLRDLDEDLAAVLAGLQADRGLRPHVGAGTGEPGRD